MPLGLHVSELRLETGDGLSRFVIRELKLTHVSEIEVMVRTLFTFLRKNHCLTARALYLMAQRAYYVLRTGGYHEFRNSFDQLVKSATDMPSGYDLWLRRHTPGDEELGKMAQTALSLSYIPVFSIVMPIYNVDERWLRKSINSVLAQIYPYWELCLADDASPKPHVRKLLQEYQSLDSRIKVTFRDKNGRISAATNSALSLATGDFICLMDHDDEIPPDALFEFAAMLNDHPDTDMIYSDEDKIDVRGNRFEPFFKPDWSPEYLESCMYTGHFACYRIAIVKELEGFRLGYEGAQDYDFVLRFVEKTTKIRHIPKVLYHWRVISPSTASSVTAKDGATQSAVKALEDRLNRLDAKGTVNTGAFPACFDVRRDIVGSPLVSIIIPSAGRSAAVLGKEIDLLSNCINNILEKSTYRTYEIIVVDNDDLKESTVKAIKSDHITFVHFHGQFNVASKFDLGTRHAKGDYLLYLNDDTEVIAPDWIEAMLQFAQRPEIGCVGAKLYFEDNTLQHVGVSFIENGMPDHVCSGFPGRSPGYFFSSVGNRNYLAVTGACFLTPRKVFEAIGGFNDKFAVNYNDIDYCLRVHEAGYRIVFTPHAELYHYESQCRERSVAPEEIDLFRELWQWKTLRDPYYNINLASSPPNFEIKPG